MAPHADPRRQRGQAIAEIVAIVGVSVMLMLGIWYLGKFHDIQAATINAARYAAWERTAQGTGQLSEADLANQVRARLFTWRTTAFQDADGRTAASRDNNRPANWQEHEDNESLIESSNDIQVSTRSTGLPGTVQAAMTQALSTISGLLSAVTGGERLPAGGMMSATVRVRIDDVDSLPELWNTWNINLTETSAVVVEGWDASGPQQAAERSRSYVLLGALGEAEVILEPLTTIMSLVEPDFRELELGNICPDIVPQDRVQGGTVLAQYQGARECY